MIKEVVISRNPVFYLTKSFPEVGTLKLIFLSLTEWKLSLNSIFDFLNLLWIVYVI